jgi:hypothetical protein
MEHLCGNILSYSSDFVVSIYFVVLEILKIAIVIVVSLASNFIFFFSNILLGFHSTLDNLQVWVCGVFLDGGTLLAPNTRVFLFGDLGGLEF